jgi:hypothetical protein
MCRPSVEHELLLQGLEHPGGAHRLLGGHAVGRHGWVSERDLPDGGVEQGAQARLLQIEPGIGRHPEREPPPCVGEWRPRREPCLDQAGREAHVGREEEVEGGPLLDLGEEPPRGAQRGPDLRSRVGGLEAADELLEGRLEVGGGGDGQRPRRAGGGGRRRRALQQRGEGKADGHL